MRCSTWRANDLTKLNRQVQLWVCLRFEPPTPHLCMMSYTGREPAFLLSFIPSDSYVSNSFPILSPSPLLGVETSPAGPGNLRQIQNIQLQLARHHLRYRMRYHPSLRFAYVPIPSVRSKCLYSRQGVQCSNEIRILRKNLFDKHISGKLSL